MMKRYKILMVMLAVLCIVGCGKKETVVNDIETDVKVMNSSAETKVNENTTVITEEYREEKETDDKDDELTGYAGFRTRTYADEDMKRLGVEKKLIVICDYRSSWLPETISTRLNELLVNKYGCDFVVEFIGYTDSSNSKYYGYGEALYDIKERGEQADIIVSGTVEDIRYSTLIENGFLMDLTDVLENTEDGKRIYDALPEKIFDLMERDGRIYGIQSDMYHYIQHVMICNEEIADRLEITVEDGFSFYEMGEILEPVSDKIREQGIIPIYFGTASYLELMGYYNVSDYLENGHGAFAKQDENGEWTAFNIFLDEEFVKLCKKIREYKDKGLLEVSLDREGNVTLAKGEFAFYVGALLDSSKMVENKVYSDKFGLVDAIVGCERMRYLVPSEVSITGIASWSEYKDEALKLLRIFQTEEEICNLLKWGIEGEQYRYENNEVIKLTSNTNYEAMEDNADMINNLITYPQYLEPDNKKEFYEELIEKAEPGPLVRYGITCGEYYELAEGYDALAEIYDKYYIGLILGEFADVDLAIAEAVTLQKKAGMDKFLDVINSAFERGTEQ